MTMIHGMSGLRRTAYDFLTRKSLRQGGQIPVHAVSVSSRQGPSQATEAKTKGREEEKESHQEEDRNTWELNASTPGSIRTGIFPLFLRWLTFGQTITKTNIINLYQPLLPKPYQRCLYPFLLTVT